MISPLWSHCLSRVVCSCYNAMCLIQYVEILIGESGRWSKGLTGRVSGIKVSERVIDTQFQNFLASVQFLCVFLKASMRLQILALYSEFGIVSGVRNIGNFKFSVPCSCTWIEFFLDFCLFPIVSMKLLRGVFNGVVSVSFPRIVLIQSLVQVPTSYLWLIKFEGGWSFVNVNAWCNCCRWRLLRHFLDGRWKEAKIQVRNLRDRNL